MATKDRSRGIPTAVLTRAKKLAGRTQELEREPTRPSPPELPAATPGKKQLTRDKVIAALKKLHPMD